MSLKRQFAASSLWTVGAAVFNNLSTMVVFVALARLLTPVQFGIVAFATVFIDLSRVLVLGGIPDALIQRAEWDDDVASTAFWSNMAAGIVLCVALAAVAAPIAGTFYDRTFGAVLAALSAVLLIEGASAVHVAKLRREFRHKVIAQRQIATNIVSGAIGVALAYDGWGVWAMVVSRLVAAASTSLILWRSTSFRPKLAFSGPHFRSIIGFSSHILGSQLLNQAGAQVPPLLIGSFLGPAAIAQYRVGSRSIGLMNSLVILPLQSAAASLFSRLAPDRDALSRAYLRLTRASALLSIPALFGIAATAPDLVPVVFGPQWTTASYVLMASALIAGPLTLTSFEASVLNASGRSGLTFLTSLAAGTGNILAAAAGLPFGAVGVAAALTLRAHLTLPFALNLMRRAAGIPWRRATAGILPPYLCAAAMALAILLARNTVLAPLPMVARLAISIPLGALLYAVLLIVLARRYVIENLSEAMPLVPAKLRNIVAKAATLSRGRHRWNAED